jgi:hypothetical protein
MFSCLWQRKWTLHIIKMNFVQKNSLDLKLEVCNKSKHKFALSKEERRLSKFFYSPTDKQVNCLKNNFKIDIKIDTKTAPTYFGATYTHQQGPTKIYWMAKCSQSQLYLLLAMRWNP